MIDLHILLQKAQKELIDFYQFLVERYVSGKKKMKAPTNASAEQVNTFFDRYNIDLSDYKFNRGELYDR
jgi:hypothetical protein